MDFDSAVSAHVEWKQKLRSAMASKSQLDAASISKDNCCPLGKWLHGEARSKFAAIPAYRECVEAHAGFHREAGRIAGLINQNRHADAEASLASGTVYANASTGAVVAINRLKREALKAA